MPQIIILLILSVLSTVSAQLFLKRGILSLGKFELSFFNFLTLILKVLQNFYLMAGLFMLGISFLLWLFLLSRIQLNILYPIAVGLNFSLIILVSWFLFKESLSPLQIAGIIIIYFGIFLASFKAIQ